MQGLKVTQLGNDKATHLINPAHILYVRQGKTDGKEILWIDLVDGTQIEALGTLEEFERDFNAALIAPVFLSSTGTAGLEAQYSEITRTVNKEPKAIKPLPR